MRQLKNDHPTSPWHDYETLLHSQNSIGWSNLTKGYASVQWESHQTRYGQMMKQRPKAEVGVWMGNIIGCYLQYVYHLWEYRNEDSNQ